MYDDILFYRPIKSVNYSFRWALAGSVLSKYLTSDNRESFYKEIIHTETQKSKEN